jgi:hypothetical protein
VAAPSSAMPKWVERTTSEIGGYCLDLEPHSS